MLAHRQIHTFNEACAEETCGHSSRKLASAAPRSIQCEARKSKQKRKL
ncbi:hypothetical protein HMPREF3227_00865 [Corynebacterium sp. CMW7794]|nr:hypothetical protein HMPREF3227_00865 [Corynebacterium sp. CMW7794]